MFLSANNVLAQTPISSQLPESNISIPIFVDLKPIFSIAESSVAKVFTSPQYPNQWVQTECATRYKYHFRRSPFRMDMQGNTLKLFFTGYYKIIGSTRICVNGKVASPWSPSCSCGFDEGERKVDVGFTSTINLQPNYLLKTTVVRNEPKTRDACEVCFWGQDVTESVLKGLKSELDITRKAIVDSFGTVNLRPYMSTLWQKLNDTYSLQGLGFFSLQPKSIRMENIKAINNLLQLNIGITANPVVYATLSDQRHQPLPNISGGLGKPGFDIYLEAALKYDSLTSLMNETLKGKRIDIADGVLKRHIIFQSATISGKENGDLKIRASFTGSFSGEIFLSGKPTYNSSTQNIEIEHLEYELQTKNLFLKTAKWLFNQKIKDELSRYSKFNLKEYYGSATAALNQQLNKEWMKGVTSKGAIQNIQVLSMETYPDYMLIRSNAAGSISFLISELNLAFNNR